MRIKAPPQRWEVEQFQASRRHDPRHNDDGHQRPRAARLTVVLHAEPVPEEVVRDADHDVGLHVVRVVPAHALEVANVTGIQDDAERRPRAQPPARLAVGSVEPEDAHSGVIQPAEDAGARREVVELLGDAEVARVEDGGEDPRGDADVGEELVEAQERVGARDGGDEVAESCRMGPEVGEGEEDREGLLHAEDAVEGPLAVELDNGAVGFQPSGGRGVLAEVVALGGAVPEEEAAMER